jgi:CBS domain-containing protein
VTGARRKGIAVPSDVYRLQVKDVMHRDVVTIDAAESVHTALEQLMENKVSALPVVDQSGRCVGILSTSDFVAVAHELDEDLGGATHDSEAWWDVFVNAISEKVGHHSVTEVMTETVIAAAPETPLVQAADDLLRARVHRMPVVDGERRVVGILSTTDVLRAFVKHAPAGTRAKHT